MTSVVDELEDLFSPQPKVAEEVDDLEWFQKRLSAALKTPLTKQPLASKPDLQETWMATGQVLTLPSGVTKELAASAIESIDLEPIFRDVGGIVAREIADVLQTMNLRPADYVDLPDMPQMVAARLGAEISTAPPAFIRSLLEQLKLRG